MPKDNAQRCCCRSGYLALYMCYIHIHAHTCTCIYRIVNTSAFCFCQGSKDIVNCDEAFFEETFVFFPEVSATEHNKHCGPNAYWFCFFVRQSCGRCRAMLLLFNTNLACVCESDRVGLSLLPCHFHDFSWELWGYLTACLNQHISCGVRGLVKGFSYLLDWCGSSSNLASSSQFRKGDTLYHACRGLSETFTNPILQRKSRHGQTLHTVHSSACHGSWQLWKLGKQPFRMRIPQRMLVYLAQAWSCGEAIQSQGAKVMFIRNYKGMEGQEGD